MARQPKPWWWKQRRCWCAQVNGQRVILGRDKADRKAAQRVLHSILAQDCKPQRERPRTIQELHEEYLAEKSHQWRRNTLQGHHIYTDAFVQEFGHEKADEFKSTQFLDWLKTRRTWNDTTRHMAFLKIAAIFKWGVDKDILVRTPFKCVTNPYDAKTRERTLTDDEKVKLLEACTDNVPFHTFYRFLLATGCRPGELRSITADDIHPDLPIASLPPERHKTGSKTKKPRTIVFPMEMMQELRELAKKHPEGPVFRNNIGTPYSSEALVQQFKRLRVKVGLDDDVVLYTARHTFGTHVAKSVPLPLAAKLMGHSNTNTIMKNYFHETNADLMNALEESRKQKDA